jgi:hypothetical protein
MLRYCTAYFLVALIMLSIICIAIDTSDYRAGSLEKQEPQSVYAADPRDAWNRIFYFLFTRTVELRLTEDFNDRGPLAPIEAMGNRSLPVTTLTFKRIESGDRAIDPLYPNFLTSKGAESVLVDPQFMELKQALKDACAEGIPRPPLYRALMQADVWGAYDILSRLREAHDQLGDRARELFPLLDQFISKLALTSQEIAALPRNYLTAERRLGLPEVFDESSGWMEVEWFPKRLHDESADYRRAVRVFLKPTTKPQKFLAAMNERVRKRGYPLADRAGSVAGAELVAEGLLIDRSGRVVPSPLTFEVQLRTFTRDGQGKFKTTTVAQYELSRKLLLADPSSGGLIRLAADEPAYLPSSGNDYTFASPTLLEKTSGPAILGNLRRRCESCHGVGATSIFTFLMQDDPRHPPVPVRQLRPADDLHADYVATEKMKRSNFKSLHLAR